MKPQVLRRWQEECIEQAPEIFASEPSRGEEQERVDELKGRIGQLTLELEVAKRPRIS